MAVTVNLTLRKDKKRKNGKAPIYLRITANRKSRFKSTGVTVRPKDWNPNAQNIRKSHDLYKALNSKLDALRLDAEREALDGSTAAGVKKKLEATGGTLTHFFEEFITGLKRRDQYWERKKYSTTLNKLQSTFGRDEIDWNELDRDALERLEHFCREHCENNANTTRKELDRVRRVVRQAMKDGVITAAQDPFVTFDMPSGIPPDRRRLTRAEVRALEEAELNGDPTVRLARDVFILSFYGGGIRFGDLCRLKPEHVHDGRLSYRMMKTRQPVDLPLPPPALEIVTAYANGKDRAAAHDGPFLFPYLEEGDESDPVRLRRRIATANAQANPALKIAARMAGIRDPNEVSMHVARHSFADFARKRSGDLYAVSKALGHSSLSITENYLSDFDRDATDRLAGELWDKGI